MHHIIVRGIERNKIFRDDTDRNSFLDRLAAILTESTTQCLAWALIPNHFHLLLRTGSHPISAVMRRLLTGYAIFFNRRHHRSGHLFQNRYKSILCQEDTYLLELARYIHLNPLRAKLVKDYRELQDYPFCGHSVIMGTMVREWQETESILRMFGKHLSKARASYEQYALEGVAVGRRKDLIGGGLIRSQGGWTVVKEQRLNKEYRKGDERILGDGAFVEQVLKNAEEEMVRKHRLQAIGFGVEAVVERVAYLLHMHQGEVLAGGKKRRTVAARSLFCFWMSRELGVSQVHLAKQLNISQAAVSLAVERGGKLVEERGYALFDQQIL
jgi:REP element-mobilizing transposase RayT